MKINSHNNISFTSKINFVDLDTFRQLPLQKLNREHKHVVKPYTKAQIIKSDEGFTYGIADCTGGGVVDGMNVTMFHLIPTKENLGAFKAVEVVLNQRIGASNELNGLIIGGKCQATVERYKNNKFKDFSDSPRLFNKIRNFFQKNKIIYSIFWGQCPGLFESHIHYSAKNDTWTVNTTNIRSNINDMKSLQETFDIVRISDKDQLFINGKEIPRKVLEREGLAK